MTPRNADATDFALRQGICGLEPLDLEPPLDIIGARVNHLVRRQRLTVAGAIAVVVALIAIVVPLTASGVRRAVEVTSHDRSVPSTPDVVVRHGKTPSSIVTDGSTPPRPNGGVVPPNAVVAAPTTSIPASPISAPSAPNLGGKTPATSPKPGAPTPTTTPTPASTPATTPVTVAPKPAPQLVTMTIDDSGLHTPVSVATKGEVTIFFLDQRTPSPHPLAAPNPQVSLRVADSNGHVVTVISRAAAANDPLANWGAQATVSNVWGMYSFQAYYTQTNDNVPWGIRFTFFARS